MNQKKSEFFRGFKSGISIALAYFSVSFTFGVSSVGQGLAAWAATLMSAANLTSAGQFAALTVMVSGGSFAELAATQAVINLRYALMSISLSQKLGESIKLRDRLLIGFFNTDEIFALAMSQKGSVGKYFMLGLGASPFLGWTIGTLCGGIAGGLLPAYVISALGIAIYSMFIALTIPPAKHSRPMLAVLLTAVALSCAFRYLPFLDGVSGGNAIIICAVTAAAVGAVAAPLPDVEGGKS